MFWILVALGVINGITVLMYGGDKCAAIFGWRRVSERTLLLIALCGGSLGALLGMVLFRHKISKESFQFTLACILFVQVGIAILFIDFPS
jgi:uncharacterized membrane protein YsdA (DUF1294 family)